jgi:hypothetical protein
MSPETFPLLSRIVSNKKFIAIMRFKYLQHSLKQQLAVLPKEGLQKKQYDMKTLQDEVLGLQDQKNSDHKNRRKPG